ncbi:MAG: metallophosphoesterase family protein [Parabacteroides sp.]|jgi:putative phosphoesterase|nr:metallophosphoesterase family protein [uncultured Macellibacteroides sp.]MBP7486954.1 metallophosphoesterase family protein [Parabacteroides sp.]MBP9481785.1 metallophosphoesterase family protein [Parabacteroides sp.]MCE5224557.1 metallophosphatase family protein [Porphyromonadaceae bacterium]
MIKIGLLSDTHAYWDDRYATYFADCDEIWHAGDIGSDTLALQLASLKPLRAVHGNIDGYSLRIQYPRVLRFKAEEMEVVITHIGGYPGRYAPEIREELYANPPQIFIAGHSHILKAQYDQKLKCMHLNPGAAGKSGFHQVRTLMRFVIDGKQLKDLEVIELGND